MRSQMQLAYRSPSSFIISAVRTAWPATRPAHSFFKFRAYSLNVLPSGFRFLDGDNPEAALALLERRLPGRWAKAQPGDVNVNVAVGFGYVEVRENAPGDRSGAEATIPEERQLEQGDQVIDV